MNVCVIDGCDRLVHSRRMCGMHAIRVRRYGSPDGKAIRPTTTERFWRKVHRPLLASDLCWLWTANTTRGGYGLFNVTSRRPVYAHRFVWELTRGPIPAGYQIDHLCRVRRCVNPEHLEPVTQQENLRRERAALERQEEEAS